MPQQPWTTQQCNFPTLRVPSLPQPPLNEEDSITYCLWMVTGYLRNGYSDSEVRLKTYVPSIDEIKAIVRTDELGFRPSQTDLTELSALVSSVHLSLDSWQGTPPKDLVEIAESNLLMDLPLIALIDDMQLRRGVRGSGPPHGITIVGTDTKGEEVGIADPWMGGVRAVSSENLEDAWDPMHHQVIEVELVWNRQSPSGTDQ